MQEVNRDAVVKLCERVFSEDLCGKAVDISIKYSELLIASFNKDPGLWWSGIGAVATIVGLVIALKSNKQAVVVEHKLPAEVVKLVDDSKKADFPAETLIVKFPTDEELTSLRTWYSTLKPPQPLPRSPWRPSFPIRATLLAEVDAERHFTARGFDRKVLADHGVRLVRKGLLASEYAVSPIFQSWADSGEEVLVACDQHGVRRYRVSDNGLTLASDHYSSNPTILWRQPPKWCRWNIHPSRGNLPCYFIDLARVDAASAALLFIQVGHSEPVRLDLSSTRLHLGGLDSIGRPDATPNPWRPGHAQLLMMDSGGISLPDGGARAVSLFQASDALVGSSGTEKHLRRFEFDQVLAPGFYVRDYSWSPDGQFFAVLIGLQYGEERGRIFVVETLNARVLAVSEWNRLLVGWHPTSGHMLLARTASEGNEDSFEFIDWEVLSNKEELTHTSSMNIDFRRLSLSFTGARARNSRSGQPNASGSLWISADASAVTVRSTEEGQHGHMRIEHEGSAAWSPTDPALFSTVGKIGHKACLRLWRISDEA